MSSKSRGRQYGSRRRTIKGFGVSPGNKPPKKRPLGFEDDEDSNNSGRR